MPREFKLRSERWDYDASRDFQTSQMRGSIGENSGRQEDAELPAVLDAAGAKSLVEAELARRWAERDRLSVRLPPALMGLMPGSILEIPGVAGRWAVQQSTIDGLSVAAELRPATGLLEALDGDAGRAALSADVPTAEARLALFEVRDSEEDQPDGATLYLAASSAEGRWKAASVELTVGGLTQTIRTSARKSVLGVTLSILSAEAEVLDVELFDREQWLESYEDSAIEHGANLAFVGDELIQFGNAEPTGPGRFRLSRLLRGCRGTGWAMLDHDSGEPFAMFDPSALQRLDLPPSMHGLSISATARGLAGTNSPTISKRTGRGRIGSDARLGPSQRRE